MAGGRIEAARPRTPMKASGLPEVQDGSALRVADEDWLGKLGDEAAARVLEVLIGVEGQALPIEHVEVERVPVGGFGSPIGEGCAASCCIVISPSRGARDPKARPSGTSSFKLNRRPWNGEVVFPFCNCGLGGR